MISIEEVKTKKQQKEFIRFPLDLYRDNPCFVPPLYADEKALFGKKRDEACDFIFFLARKDGKTVGRIQGILQKDANKKFGQKRVRFTRFDCIDDSEAAAALFGAVENWARSIGMNAVCGPLGCSDLEREGLLVEGFDRLSTFEEQYNAPYYRRLVEENGYAEEARWLEYLIYPADASRVEIHRKTADYVMRRYKLRYAEFSSKRDLISRYFDSFLAAVETAYSGLYGTVPFSEPMKKGLKSTFRLVIDKRFVRIIVNEQNEVAFFELVFPSLSKALLHSGGHLSPRVLCRVLRALRRPEVLDFALVGVGDAYKNKGIGAIAIADLTEFMAQGTVRCAETNLCLVDNYPIQNLWKNFPKEQHKTRLAYVKRLTEDADDT